MIKVEEDECERWVLCGDYEHNDGQGGAALMPLLDNGKYKSSVQAGSVEAWSDDPSTGAQFSITTEVMKSRTGYYLGKVVDGLEVVVAAYKHHPISEVIVVDCGVVLWKDGGAVG